MHSFYWGSESVRRGLERAHRPSIERSDMHHNNDIDDYVCDETDESVIIIGRNECTSSGSLCVHSEEIIAYEFFRLSITNQDSILSSATLERALNIFDSPDLLRELDQDLELVQKQLKSKQDHASYFNQKVNDKFRKLSYKYHPDRISSKGGADEEIKKATELQTAVNIVWSVLKMLHGNFIDNNYLSDQNFKYSTCSTVEIAILNNEERLKNLNNKILIELCWLSRIKQEKMIPNLNKFLICSESCIQSFLLEEYCNFEKERKQAHSYFNLFFSGYNEMFSAVKTLRDECRRRDDLAYIKSMAEKFVQECENHISKLRSMKKLYFQHFVKIKYLKSDVGNAEMDFVSPFAEYSSLLFSCQEIVKKRNEGERRPIAWFENFTTGLSTCMASKLQDGQYDFSEETFEAYYDNVVVDFHRVSSLSKNNVKKRRKMTDKELENLRKELKDRAGSDVHYELLICLTFYYCRGGKQQKADVNTILQQELKLPVKIHCETCLEPLKVIIDTYAEHLKSKFQPVKIYSECDIKGFKKDVEKLVEEFTSSMREEARKGQQEVREAQLKISNELKEMNNEFEEGIREATNKTAENFKNIEAKLREDEKNRNRLVECLEKERQERTKREEELKEELEEKARVEEEKLREESEKAYKVREERLARQLQELTKTMKEFLGSDAG